MHDLVIRGGTIVDGTGRPRFGGDVAVDGGRITAVGRVDGRGRRELDAAGCLVTPGFVDIHTHYDGQVTWDSEIAPSSWHGVTSIVMGNCGVGFAPAAPDKHEFLIALMEGVEDIPGTALAEGLTWDWETLPQYLDAVDRKPHAVDIGAQVPHAALRAYVMGERGADHEQDPTPDEIAEMARLTEEALAAGAVGFATSRTLNHRSRSGQKIGTLIASNEELLGIAQALRRSGRGVIQFISDFIDLEFELGLMRHLAEQSGRPVSVSLTQTLRNPGLWKPVLRLIEESSAAGLPMKAQVAPRAVGVLLGLQASVHPFISTPAYQAIAGLPLDERVARMREPEIRARMIAEYGDTGGRGKVGSTPFRTVLSHLFPLGDPPEYEPDPAQSVEARAERLGLNPLELVYDMLLERDGRALLYQATTNFVDGNFEAVREMALSPATLFGLSDGGAHVGAICDASFPTFSLSYWARDRQRGEGLPLEYMVKRQTSGTAHHVGWKDRGVVAPGYKADLNVIDFDRLQLHAPELAFDLPAGGKRLLQRADGYRYTLLSGAVTFEDGKPTGELPGRLVRGAQAASAGAAVPASA